MSLQQPAFERTNDLTLTFSLMSTLTPEDKQLLTDAMALGPLTMEVIDEVKAAHGNKYPIDFHAFVSNIQPEAFNISVAQMTSAPGPRSAAALKIEDMCEAKLTTKGQNIASACGVEESDVRHNVFIVYIDSRDSSRVAIYGMMGKGFSVGRHDGDIFQATRSIAGGKWVRA